MRESLSSASGDSNTVPVACTAVRGRVVDVDSATDVLCICKGVGAEVGSARVDGTRPGGSLVCNVLIGGSVAPIAAAPGTGTRTKPALVGRVGISGTAAGAGYLGNWGVFSVVAAAFGLGPSAATFLRCSSTLDMVAAIVGFSMMGGFSGGLSGTGGLGCPDPQAAANS